MGLIISRYWKKKNAEELLEQLQEDIDNIQNKLQYSSERKKVIIVKLYIYSIVFYLLIAAVLYFYPFPPTWKGRVLICLPLIGIPLLVEAESRAAMNEERVRAESKELPRSEWRSKARMSSFILLTSDVMPCGIFFAKQFVSWLYERSMTKGREKLADLLKQKKKTLEDVKKNETYSKAKVILDKYDDEQKKKSPIVPSLSLPTAAPRNEQSNPNPSALRTPVQTIQRRTLTPARTSSPNSNRMPNMLVRPIFSKDRGLFDKLVENLIGDGPNNRYALICKNCASHNGMALKEEFEYLAFRCVYCGFPNPSRKVMPRPSIGPPSQASRLSLGPNMAPQRLFQGADDSATTSDNESTVKIVEVTDDNQSSENKTKLEGDSRDQADVEEEIIIPEMSSVKDVTTSSTEQPAVPEKSETTETAQSANENKQ